MSVSRRRFAGVVGGVVAALYGSHAFADDPPASSEKEFESWWDDLEKVEPHSSRALLKFSSRPAEAIAFFKPRMKPLKIEADDVRALIAKLDSGEESTWKPAFEELEYFDPRLAIGLEDLMKEFTQTPARTRLVEVLSGRTADSLKGKNVQLRQHGNPGDEFFNFFADNGSWWAEARVSRLSATGWGNPKKKWTRANRAIILLEHINTPEAIAVIKRMALGHPDAEPTRVARSIVMKDFPKPG
jgi:hypothetical protein